MVQRPQTHYVKTADGVHIAYQVIGDGPDLLHSVGAWWHLDYQWEIPDMRRRLERLARSHRVILFDKRGTGLSDRVPPDRVPDLSGRLEDVRAVLDAVQSERTSLVGLAHGGDLVMAFAAAEPERTEALVLIDTYATLLRTEDHPWGLTDVQAQTSLERMEQHWDEPQGYDRLADPGDHDALALERWMMMQRISVSPSAARALWQTALETDVRPLLGDIRARTLVLHHDANRLVDPRCGRFLASAIPNATFQALRKQAAVWDDNAEEMIAIEEFLTGRSATYEPERVLATVLFTDIVNSTALAARVGDRRWRSLLDEHDRIVTRSLQRHGGRKVNPTGDGMLATFASPARAIHCAAELRDLLASIDVAIRAGIHIGEVEVRGDDLGGIAVNIGARVSALAGSGQILVTRTVTEVVTGSDVDFVDHGEHELKGIPGTWHLFAAR